MKADGNRGGRANKVKSVLIVSGGYNFFVGGFVSCRVRFRCHDRFFGLFMGIS